MTALDTIITIERMRDLLSPLRAWEEELGAFSRRWPDGATVREILTGEWDDDRRAHVISWLLSEHDEIGLGHEILAIAARDADEAIRLCVAVHPACPPDILSYLAHDPDPDVRCAVVRHPSCPQSVFCTLVADECPRVRWYVAANAPLRVTESLLGDSHPEVRSAAEYRLRERPSK